MKEEDRRGDEVAPSPVPELPVTVIEAKPGWHFVNLAELWRYRQILFFLTWRDVKVRYKQTVFGATWAVVQPLTIMLAFSLSLGKLGTLPTGGVPYPLFAFSGLLVWFFFANSINSAGMSVVGNQNLLTKIYFPRLILPLSAVGLSLLDFLIGFVLLLGMSAYYGVAPGWGLLLVPVLVLGLALAALGFGTLLSALTVPYRDFRAILPFLLQAWMFATPVVYLKSEAVISPTLRPFMPLNPAYGLILNFRAAVLGEDLDLYALAVSAAVSLVLLGIGCFYFRRVERGFADII